MGANGDGRHQMLSICLRHPDVSPVPGPAEAVEATCVVQEDKGKSAH